ncbi:MAG: GyrI-like domain-containing protein [Chitinophagaceae bacterium]
MKKWSVLFLILLIVFISSVYLFTSPARSFHAAVEIPVSAEGGFRSIYNQVNWDKWWPGEKIADNHFRFGKHEYRIRDKQLSSLTIDITGSGDSLASRLNLIISGADSLGLVWIGFGPSSSNILTRMKWSLDQSLHKETQVILDSLRSFYSKEENIYGFPVTATRITDTALISVSKTMAGMPSTTEIYSMLDKLHAYTSSIGIREINSPMLNISRAGDSILVRVAIPIEKRVPDSGDLQYRWMLPGGLMCVATVTGGPHTALNAVTTMETYLKDHGLNQPAIPYQSLVTDRRAEPDTSKWITKIYCPYF